MTRSLQGDANDRWYWSEDACPPLDFCVRALRLDGLRAEPFDQHPDGDHSLRDHGLDAAAWRAWAEAVVDAQGRLGAHIRGPEWRADRATLVALAHAASTPALLCPGIPELRARLGEMWAEYRPEGERWKQDMTRGKRRDRVAPHHERWLWQALGPLHGRLPTLSVFLVDYPMAAVMLLPPTSCLIAPEHSDAGGEAYTRMVLRAAEELASA